MPENNVQENVFNVDEALEQLEAINRKLASKEINLNDSLELYKQGVELAAKCKAHLSGVETELQKINSAQN